MLRATAIVRVIVFSAVLGAGAAASAREPVVTLRGYYGFYAPSAKAAYFGYWPYAPPPAVVVLPRMYDYRGLDPWRGGAVPSYGSAYRSGNYALRAPIQSAPLPGVAAEVIPAPPPASSGPREF